MAFAAMGDRVRAWELATMINPARRASTPQGMATYKVEPYVVSADVYAVDPHAGRGGWSWYTGSAGWMYRLLVESLLGLELEAGRLRITPRLPAAWNGCTIRYRYGSTLYTIAIVQPAAAEEGAGSGGGRVTLDGAEQADGTIGLVDDRLDHRVYVRQRTDEGSGHR
jgi:cellobiose phosphorylase